MFTFSSYLAVVNEVAFAVMMAIYVSYAVRVGCRSTVIPCVGKRWYKVLLDARGLCHGDRDGCCGGFGDEEETVWYLLYVEGEWIGRVVRSTRKVARDGTLMLLIRNHQPKTRLVSPFLRQGRHLANAIRVGWNLPDRQPGHAASSGSRPALWTKAVSPGEIQSRSAFGSSFLPHAR